MKFWKHFFVLVFLMGITFHAVKSQDSASVKTSPFSFNTDLVTSYVWRGTVLNNMPNLQPYFSFTKGGFECGSWGSVSVAGDFSEVDLYASYTLSKFNILATDYYVLSDNPEANYFDFSKKTTGHSVEGSISFDGAERFPLSLLAATFVYGDDKDTLGKNYYSTYFEATYAFSSLHVFIGLTPWKGLYGDGAGVVLAGIKLNKEIKITEDFAIPAFISLAANPRSEKIFLIAGFTF